MTLLARFRRVPRVVEREVADRRGIPDRQRERERHPARGRQDLRRMTVRARVGARGIVMTRGAIRGGPYPPDAVALARGVAAAA